MKRMLSLLLLLSLLLAMGGTSALAEGDGVLKLPATLKTIEEEAFSGDTSLDEVILPEGITSIGPWAFEGSSLRRINLPDSLTAIDDSALPAAGRIVTDANEGSYAYSWAVKNGYIDNSGAGENNLRAWAANDQYSFRVGLGESVTLAVEAESDAQPLSYFWFKEDIEDDSYPQIDGANGPSYETGPINAAADYFCTVNDPYGNEVEVWFSISVDVDTHLEAYPENYNANVSLSENGTAELRVTASCDVQPLSYRWLGKRIGDEYFYFIDGAAGSSFVADQVGQYLCRVSDIYGNIVHVYFSVVKPVDGEEAVGDFEVVIPKGVIVPPTMADVSDETMQVEYNLGYVDEQFGEVYCRNIVQASDDYFMSFALIYDEGSFNGILVFGGDPQGEYIYNWVGYAQTYGSVAIMQTNGMQAAFNGDTSQVIYYDKNGNVLYGEINGERYEPSELHFSENFNPPRPVIRQTDEIITLWKAN